MISKVLDLQNGVWMICYYKKYIGVNMEYKYATKEGVFTLKEYKKGLEVVSYEGEDIYLAVPAYFPINNKEETDAAVLEKPVISIGKKAMLSCKSLRWVSLPETIEEVGDWAFAYCDALWEVCLPEKEIRFGKGVFRECGKICAITVEGKHQNIGVLLAAVVTLLDTPYLFTPVRCGREDWLKQWDAHMLQVLREADMEGFFKMGLWGEEDCDCKENNAEYFLNQKRKKKVRIAYLRLLNPLGLSEDVRQELICYLQAHTTGTSDETWQVLREEHGEDSEYYKLFTEIGCLTKENFDCILSQAGEEYPEMKAWFLKYKEETIGYTDFFEELML